MDIFPLMCATDKVWITKLTLIHKNISFVPNSYAQVYTCMSICRNSHYDDVDKNNNDSSKRLDRHYHKYPSSPYQTRWDISDNICLSVFKIVVILYIKNANITYMTSLYKSTINIRSSICFAHLISQASPSSWYCSEKSIIAKQINDTIYMYLFVMLLSQWTVH